MLPPLPAEVPHRGSVVPPEESGLIQSAAFGTFDAAVGSLLPVQVLERRSLRAAALVDLGVDAVTQAMPEQGQAGTGHDQGGRELDELQAAIDPEDVRVFSEEFQTEDLVFSRRDARIGITPERRFELPGRFPLRRVVRETDVVDAVLYDGLGDFVTTTELCRVNQNSIHG